MTENLLAQLLIQKIHLVVKRKWEWVSLKLYRGPRSLKADVIMMSL